jgi:hypothetical protein
VTRRLAAVVEGHGELEALPLVLRRFHEREPSLLFPALRQNDIIRVSRSKLIKEGEIERAVELAARKVGTGGGVLVLLDADDDAACELGPALLERAWREGIEVAVIVAVREYESWFLFAAASLAGIEGLPHDLQPPNDPGAIRGAKEWLSHRMGTHGPYRPRLHQARFSRAMSLDVLGADRSFQKLEKEVRRLLSPSPTS